MSDYKTRMFSYNGRNVRFSYDGFRTRFNAYKEYKSLTREKLKENIAENCCVSSSAVNNWLCRKNGPGDIQTISAAAKTLEVSVEALITDIDEKKEGEYIMGGLSERQRDAVRRIYVGITTFLDEFLLSDGFGNYYCLGVLENRIKSTDEMYEYIDKKIQNLQLLLKCEYLDLHGCDIYEELYDYITGDLIDLYDCKVAYAYRFENGGTTEDYEKASKRLVEIIEKYW